MGECKKVECIQLHFISLKDYYEYKIFYVCPMVTSGKTSLENIQKKTEKGMLVRNTIIKAYRKQRTKKDTHTHTVILSSFLLVML